MANMSMTCPLKKKNVSKCYSEKLSCNDGKTDVKWHFIGGHCFSKNSPPHPPTLSLLHTCKLTKMHRNVLIFLYHCSDRPTGYRLTAACTVRPHRLVTVTKKKCISNSECSKLYFSIVISTERFRTGTPWEL